MISQDSFHSNGATSTSVLDALEGHQTDAEFQDMVQKNRLLAVCKQKGFKHLEKLGVSKNKLPISGNTAKELKASEKFHERRKANAIKAKKLRESGYTFEEIHKELGVWEKSLRLAWKAYDIQPDQAKHREAYLLRITKDEHKEAAFQAADLYNEGKTLREAARAVNLNVSFIRQLWDRFDIEVKMRPRGGTPRFDIKEVLHLVNEFGYSQQQAAKAVDAPPPNVSNAMRNAGYQYDRKSKRYNKSDA